MEAIFQRVPCQQTGLLGEIYYQQGLLYVTHLIITQIILVHLVFQINQVGVMIVL